MFKTLFSSTEANAMSMFSIREWKTRINLDGINFPSATNNA